MFAGPDSPAAWDRGRRTCPPRCRGRAPPRGRRGDRGAALPRSSVSAALPRSRATAEPPRGSRPTNMSAALPRSAVARDLASARPRQRRLWGRRTCPPRCRGRAPPRGRGADEHVRRAAEVARHRGAVGPPRGSRPTNMSAALPPRSRLDRRLSGGPTLLPRVTPRSIGRCLARRLVAVTPRSTLTRSTGRLSGAPPPRGGESRSPSNSAALDPARRATAPDNRSIATGGHPGAAHSQARRTQGSAECRLSPAWDPGFSSPLPPCIILRDEGDLRATRMRTAARCSSCASTSTAGLPGSAADMFVGLDPRGGPAPRPRGGARPRQRGGHVVARDLRGGPAVTLDLGSAADMFVGPTARGGARPRQRGDMFVGPTRPRQRGGYVRRPHAPRRPTEMLDLGSAADMVVGLDHPGGGPAADRFVGPTAAARRTCRRSRSAAAPR
jgi:hypothetical protein